MKHPPRWEAQARAIEALLQGCKWVGRERFGLELDRAPSVYLVSWRRVEFIADWERNEILLSFRFHPAIDQWLYTTHFGACHEYGHLLWHPSNLILREAWANLFGLQVLSDLRVQPSLVRSKPNVLALTKDYALIKGLIRLMLCLPGETGRIGRVLWELQQFLKQGKWSEMRRFFSLALQAETLPEEERLTYLMQLLAETLACPRSLVQKWLVPSKEDSSWNAMARDRSDKNA